MAKQLYTHFTIWRNDECDEFFYNFMSAPEETDGTTETKGCNFLIEGIPLKRGFLRIIKRMRDVKLKNGHLVLLTLHYKNHKQVKMVIKTSGLHQERETNRQECLWVLQIQNCLSQQYSVGLRVDNKQRQAPLSKGTVEIRCQDRRATNQANSGCCLHFPFQMQSKWQERISW